MPGTFELPVVADALAEEHDAVVALGVVVRGGTPHFDYVCSAATDGLTGWRSTTASRSACACHSCDTDEQALEPGLQARARTRAGRPRPLATAPTLAGAAR